MGEKFFSLTEKPRSRRDTLRLLGAGGLAALLATRGVKVEASAQTEEPIPEVVIDWFGAWMDDNPSAAVAALYTADASYENVASRDYVLGPNIEGYVKSILDGLEYFERHMRGTMVEGNNVIVEQLVRGTNGGLFPSAPNGAEFQFYAVTIFEVEGTLLSRTADYFDFTTVLDQIGQLPSPIWTVPHRLD